MRLLSVMWIASDETRDGQRPAALGVECSCGYRTPAWRDDELRFNRIGDAQARCRACNHRHTFTRAEIEKAPRA